MSSSKRKQKARRKQERDQAARERRENAAGDGHEALPAASQELPETVTCSFHDPAHLVRSLVVIAVGVIAALLSSPTAQGTILLIEAGPLRAIFAFVALYGVFDLAQWARKALTVSSDGVLYQPVLGPQKSYGWGDVRADYLPGEGAPVVFVLDGRRVSFERQCPGQEQLVAWMDAHQVPRTGELEHTWLSPRRRKSH